MPKKAPRRTMSLSPGWRLGDSLDSGSGGRVGDSEDEVELFMEKYVLPLQDSSSSICEYDSGDPEAKIRVCYFPSKEHSTNFFSTYKN